MKLCDCLELSVAQKDKIEEILTKLVSEKSPSDIARYLTRIIDAIVWSRYYEAEFSRSVDFLENVKIGADSYNTALSIISIYLLNDYSKEKNSDDVLPDNDQSQILEFIDKRIHSLKKEEK